MTVPTRPFAAPFLAAAAYHLTGLLRPGWTEPAPPWRHALFVAVNALAAAALWRWRRAWLPAFAALAAQQLWSHGRYGLAVWRLESRIDWASVAVLLFMPALLAALWSARSNAAP